MEITNSTYPQQQLNGQFSNLPDQDSRKAGNKDREQEQNVAQKQRLQQEILELKSVEQKVIAHEMAHKSAGGPYAGAVTYEYRKGPDGKMYISGGEVSIDISNGKNPEETIQKMEQVQRAALAPADPSPQDRAVAAAAIQIEQAAKAELIKEQLNPATKNKKNAYSADQSTDKNNASPISIFA